MFVNCCTIYYNISNNDTRNTTWHKIGGLVSKLSIRTFITSNTVFDILLTDPGASNWWWRVDLEKEYLVELVIIYTKLFTPASKHILLLC